MDRTSPTRGRAAARHAERRRVERVEGDVDPTHAAGAQLVGVGMMGVDAGAFWSQMQAKVTLVQDVVNGVVIKSLAFGLVVSWIAVFEGYDAVPTSEGVSAATTRTVVHSSLAILGLDFVLTGLMFN